MKYYYITIKVSNLINSYGIIIKVLVFIVLLIVW